MKIHSTLALLSLVTLSACASNRAWAPASYAYRAPSGSYATVTSTQTSSGYAPAQASAPAPVAPSSYGGSVTSEASVSRSVDVDLPASDSGSAPVNVAPEARPGLATEWGESRHSAMSYAPFVRASSQPVDVAMIHYNDAQLAAMQAMQHSARPTRWVGIRRDAVRLSLRDDNGDALQGYFAGDTVYVLGNAGQHYTIVIENTTPARFETVVSVDGLDVINGRPASMGQRGYILQPYGRVEVEGFRQSRDTVASFRFGSVGDSYAAQTGDARNVGVIGVALFAERGAVLDLEQNEIELRERANPFPNGFATPPARRYY